MTDRLTKIEGELERLINELGPTTVTITGQDIRWMARSLRELVGLCHSFSLSSSHLLIEQIEIYKDGDRELSDELKELLLSD